MQLSFQLYACPSHSNCKKRLENTFSNQQCFERPKAPVSLRIQTQSGSFLRQTTLRYFPARNVRAGCQAPAETCLRTVSGKLNSQPGRSMHLPSSLARSLVSDPPAAASGGPDTDERPGLEESISIFLPCSFPFPRHPSSSFSLPQIPAVWLGPSSKPGLPSCLPLPHPVT